MFLDQRYISCLAHVLVSWCALLACGTCSCLFRFSLATNIYMYKYSCVSQVQILLDLFLVKHRKKGHHTRGNKKLKEKLRRIETHNCVASEVCLADSTDSTSKEKTMKKKNVMQLESKEKGIAKKAKSLKSKDTQARLDDSKKSGRVACKRTRYTDTYEDVEAKFSVMERADRVLSQLENEHPYFLKCMLPSNVSHGFWLHLPKKFCRLHLPNHDSSIVLVDEWGNEYKMSYLLGRHGLSAGWRGFSISHRLLKGDLLIFHLIEPFKLKVHIVRVHGPDVIGAALCLMNWSTSDRELDSAEDLVKKENKKQRKPKYVVEPFLLDSSTPSKNLKARNEPKSVIEPAAEQRESNSEVLEGSEITDQLQHNDLCYSKASFLKDGHCEGIACT